MEEPWVASAFDDIINSKPVYTTKGPGPKRLLVMSGLPLSGKTFFVDRLMKKRPDNFILINSHDTRPVVVKHMGRKRPSYDKTEHLATFEVAGKLVERTLKMNWPVIADATNLREKYREWAVSAGDRAGAETMVVFMQVSDEMARRRISERTSRSSATFDTYQQLKYEQESVSQCSKPYIIVDSEAGINPHVEKVCKWLSGGLECLPNAQRAKKAASP